MKIPFFGKTEAIKANPPTVMFADELTRGALNKATMPNFMLRPPFGVPRFKDVITLRRLASTPQAAMAKQIIIDQVVNTEWNIIPRDENLEEIPDSLQNKIDEVEMFLNNPNTNNESFEFITRAMLNDLLDLDSGIWVKEFTESGDKMVEIKFADAATFLKNPDIFGKYTTREDVIPFGTITVDSATRAILGMDGNRTGIDSAAAVNAAIGYQTPVGLSIDNAREQAAYFQFGFLTNVRPIAFGRREIVWFEKNPQSNQIYGKGPIEDIMNVLQTLKYSIEYNLDYFEDNNVPKGFINMPGSDQDEMDEFRNKWNELQLTANAEGLLKKNFHRVPITNVENANFIRVQFSSAELQLIESQQWFSKLVWSRYGVTPSELGFTEDSNLATEINQSRVFRRKAILPLLSVLEFFINHCIITEWDFADEIKFAYNTFDVEDEKSKMELYKTQIESGFKEVNEIRKLEGLEELEEKAEEVQLIDSEEMEDIQRNPKDPDPEKSKRDAEKKADPTLKDIMNLLVQIIEKDKKKLMREIKNSSGDRLTQIKDFSSVMSSIRTAFDIDGLRALIEKATQLIFNKGMDEAESTVKAEGIEVNIVTSSPQKIDFLANMAFENMKGLTDDLQNKLRQQVKIGVANGEGIGSITQRIEKAFDVSKARAETIARTEASRIESQGTLHAAQQLKDDGVNLKKWLLWTNDSRTSELTKALHRKYGSEEQAIPVNQNFTLDFKGRHISQSAPPFHPNERDALMTLIVDKGE